MIAIVVMETTNITPSVMPPMTTTGELIALLPSEVERSFVGVALVVVIVTRGMLSCGEVDCLAGGREVGVAWGVVKEEECWLVGVA